MANYCYGTLKEEVARGVVNYKLDAVTVGFSLVRCSTWSSSSSSLLLDKNETAF